MFRRQFFSYTSARTLMVASGPPLAQNRMRARVSSFIPARGSSDGTTLQGCCATPGFSCCATALEAGSKRVLGWLAAALQHFIVDAESIGGVSRCHDARAVFCCVAALAIAGSLHLVDKDLLGWWLCERQVPSGGLNGRPEKLPDVSPCLLPTISHSPSCGIDL